MLIHRSQLDMAPSLLLQLCSDPVLDVVPFQYYNGPRNERALMNTSGYVYWDHQWRLDKSFELLNPVVVPDRPTPWSG